MKRVRSENDARVEEEKDLNLLDLPFDMMAHIFLDLSVLDLLASSLVCKALHEVTQNDRIWFPLCQSLWQGKQLYHNKTHKDELSWKAAYVVSLLDSKRTILTPEELFRFKWLYSRSVRIAVEVTPVSKAAFYPNGDIKIKPLPNHQWTFFSGDRMETFQFRHAISQHSYFDISRNAADWGWKMTTYNDELYQTFDPSLPSQRPIVLISTYTNTYLTTGTFGQDGMTILLDPFDVGKIAIQNAAMSCSSDDSDYDSSYNEEEEAWKD